MKLIIALVMTVALATASTTLAETGSYKFTINFSKNSSNSSNSDVVLGLTVGSTTAPMTASQYATGACVNVATSNYQLTTSSTTLKGFGIEWQCHSTCGSLAAVYNSVTFYAGAHWGQTATTHLASSQSTLTSVTSPAGTNTNNDTAKAVYHTFTGLTPTQLASTVYMPNQTETWYVRCFARFDNAASAALAGGVSDLSSTLGNGKNLSLKGNGYQVATILAVAGSLVASLA